MTIDKAFKSDSDIHVKFGYVAAKAIIMAKKGEANQSQQILNNEVKDRFTESVYNKLKEEIASIQ